MRSSSAQAPGGSAPRRGWSTGIQPIVVESLERLGGRASTEEIEGFKVNIGAIALEVGGVFEETFHPSARRWISGSPSRPRRSMSTRTSSTSAAAAGAHPRSADEAGGPDPGHVRRGPIRAIADGRQSTAEWLSSFTSNESVHAIFRNLCAAVFACNADELPARAFLTYFTSKGAFRRFGFCPSGTIGAWESLASVIEHNGEISLTTPAVKIHTSNGRVEGVTVTRDGQQIRIDSNLVISNAGPKITVALGGEAAFPPLTSKKCATGFAPLPISSSISPAERS